MSHLLWEKWSPVIIVCKTKKWRFGLYKEIIWNHDNLSADLPYWNMNKTISKSGLCHPICFVFLSFLTAYSNTYMLLINRRYDVGKSVYFEIHIFCVFSSIESMQLYFWNCSNSYRDVTIHPKVTNMWLFCDFRPF